MRIALVATLLIGCGQGVYRGSDIQPAVSPAQSVETPLSGPIPGYAPKSMPNAVGCGLVSGAGEVLADSTVIGLQVADFTQGLTCQELAELVRQSVVILRSRSDWLGGGEELNYETHYRSEAHWEIPTGVSVSGYTFEAEHTLEVSAYDTRVVLHELFHALDHAHGLPTYNHENWTERGYDAVLIQFVGRTGHL